MRYKKLMIAQAVFSALLIFLFPVVAASQEPFYKGKTVTIILGTTPGGSPHLRLRAAVPFLQKYIPGNPTILLEFMPGAGGRTAANHIYQRVRPDGLTIGQGSTAVIPTAILGEPGVHYDVDKLIYLGTSFQGVRHVFMTRTEAGLDSLEKIRAASAVRIGAQAVGHFHYYGGRLFAYVIGMKEPKLVTGYSSQDISIALMRGEVDARIHNADSVLREKPDWIDKGLVNFHAIIDIPKGTKHAHPAFARLPDLETLARSDRERSLIELHRTFIGIPGPFVLPPNTPEERVRVLRDAFRRTFKDPEYRKQYKTLTGEDADPLMPEELEKAIRELPRDPEIIDLYKKLGGFGPLPPK